MERSYFVVEGPHDVEVIGRLLRLNGLTRVQMLEDLDEYWKPTVPTSYPPGGDLLKRVPLPVFFASESHSVAVQSAGGISKIAAVVKATLNTLDDPPEGLGFVLDADQDQPEKRWADLADALPFDDFGTSPGTIFAGRPRVGIYVLPDNQAQGTLEHLLLACADVAYPTLLASARAHVDPLDPSDKSVFLNARERQDLAAPHGKDKAVAATIAAVLRPGKAVQVSIQDNQWLRDPVSLTLPIVAQFRSFVEVVAGLAPAPVPAPGPAPAAPP